MEGDRELEVIVDVPEELSHPGSIHKGKTCRSACGLYKKGVSMVDFAMILVL